MNLLEVYSSDVDTKCGVKPRELETAPLARISPEPSPHSLPILTQECNKRSPFSNGWCVLEVMGGAPFIALQGRYLAGNPVGVTWKQV